jgi:hypothetical protein
VKGPTASSPNTIAGKSGVVVRPGTGGSLAVTQNGGGNMSVNVASGVAYIRGTENVYQGGYWFLNDATVNLAVTGSDPTNNRTDSVYIAIRDQFYSGANNDAVLLVAAGSPSTPTTPPTLPANSLEIARITVVANTTSILTANIADRRPWLTGLGGITPVRSFETTDPGTVDGDVSYVSLTGLRFWDSAASVWRAYPVSVNALTDITSNATPKTDQHTVVTGTNLWYRWNGSAWVYAPIPQGVRAYGKRATTSTGTTSIVGVLRLDDIPIFAGRSYTIMVTGIFARSTVNNDRALIEVRATFDSSTPTTSSIVMVGGQAYQWVIISGGSIGQTGSNIDIKYEPVGSETLSVLVTVSRQLGTGTVDLYADSTHKLKIEVTDTGPAVGDTGTSI